MRTPINREDWLQRAVQEWRPWFKTYNVTLPPLQVSCGFPSKGVRATTGRRDGECWGAEAAADQVPHILVSPAVQNGGDVLAILLHECVHAALGSAAGHGSKFRELATRLGLEGKMTCTVPGPALIARFRVLLEVLGPYPHGALNVGSRKKQGTRMLKAFCPSCSAIVRLTQKQVNEPGLPWCNCQGGAIQFELAGTMDSVQSEDE